ncbi:MAG TPA: hypothetical protein ENG63_07870 [Candidatus Desulfofervidus auxilii]|uniref:Pyruvate kinase C-terminal domain-containing protein n=1 Tax=Desulfofervidus auxilii TaxID=1621989 RepID=A0A7C0U3B7_DESA2|nr:hypothetical protein [Candidatus Desulfofervidus auxilii]
MIRREVWFFKKAGPENTSACLDILVVLAEEDYQDFVIASTTGETGRRAAERLKPFGVNVVVVAHSVGFKEPNHDEFLKENYEAILAAGGKIYKGTILTHSLETAFAKKFGGVYPTLIIAQSLRRLGEGIKVCCEIVMEACDAGLIEEGKEVVAMAGTVRGADTVAILKSATSKRFLDLKVLEILAKPRI